MHNARHSFAVRWMKAGANPQDIANNLGHCGASQVVTRCGKYRVTLSDLAETRRHLRLAK
jgi:site-specific recombinase XerD